MNKSRDNVIDLDGEREVRTPPSAMRRVLGKAGTLLKWVVLGVVLIIAAVIGGFYLLNQGENLASARQWLDEVNGVLMIWRTVMYCGALWLGPRFLLNPNQQTDPKIVRKARWIIFAVAMGVEILLVQKGLAAIAQLIQGGF